MPRKDFAVTLFLSLRRDAWRAIPTQEVAGAAAEAKPYVDLTSFVDAAALRAVDAYLVLGGVGEPGRFEREPAAVSGYKLIPR